MKRLFPLFFLVLFTFCKNPNPNSRAQTNKIVLAYITSGNNVMPDPAYVTHVNYAFGTVKAEHNGVDIQNPEKLREIVKLRNESNNLKIMLSIGGWGAGGFSEMASNKETRAAFVNDCKKIVDEFKLDGIDMDWEYPSSSAANIASTPEDTDNFTALMKELRDVLGEKQLLTFASAARADYVDFNAVMPYCDFVNIMAYDMGRPPRHNAGLHPSEKTRMTAHEAVEAHIAAGVAPEKLVLGVAFYGHGDKNKGFPDYVNYSSISAGEYKDYTHKWDEVSMVPYVVDANDELIISYDSPESLIIKSKYAIDRGLLGVMYWEYACDDPELTLTKAVYNTVFTKE